MQTIEITRIQPGWDVLASDGQKIGSTADVAPQFVTVRKGMLMPKDYYVPASGIQEARPDDASIVLNCSKDEFENMGWDQLPDDSATFSGTGMAHRTGEPEQTADYRTTQSGQAGQTETERVPRYEEELRAEKSRQQTGEVRVTKDVEEDEQSFGVPVMRDDVEVRRVGVNRPAGADEQAFSEGDTIKIPVTEEQVQVTKEPRVVEEIEVRKTPRQETRQVSDTVRRERVNVEGAEDTYSDDRQPALSGADRMQGQQGWDTEPETQRSYEESTRDDIDDTNEPLV